MRICLTKTLEDQVEGKRLESLLTIYAENLLFHLSMCYNMGFGTARDAAKSTNLLEKADRSRDNRSISLKQCETSTQVMALGILYGSLARLGQALPITHFHYYVEKGILETAKVIMNREIQDLGNAMGDNSRLIVFLQTQLGAICCEKGKWKEAADTYSDIVKKSRDIDGKDPQYTVNAMMSLFPVYQLRGRWNEAIRLAVEGLRTMKENLGSDHLTTIAASAQVASIFCDQGQWKEAAKMLEDVEDAVTKMLGPEHPDTLASKRNLALVYSNLGRLKEAEVREDQAIETSKRILGE